MTGTASVFAGGRRRRRRGTVAWARWMGGNALVDSGLRGILNVNKPSGPTSRDVVNRVARILPESQGRARRDARSAGHGGARRLRRLDDAADRIRPADAQDVPDGRPPGRPERHAGRRRAGHGGRATAIPDEGEVRRARRGPGRGILQVPPEFSALKVQGRRAHDLARGPAVELAPRAVRIDRIELLAYSLAPAGARDRLRRRDLHPLDRPRRGRGAGLRRPGRGPDAGPGSARSRWPMRWTRRVLTPEISPRPSAAPLEAVADLPRIRSTRPGRGDPPGPASRRRRTRHPGHSSRRMTALLGPDGEPGRHRRGAIRDGASQPRKVLRMRA